MYIYFPYLNYWYLYNNNTSNGASSNNNWYSNYYLEAGTGDELYVNISGANFSQNSSTYDIRFIYADTLNQTYGSHVINDNLWQDWNNFDSYTQHDEFGLYGYVNIPNNQSYGWYDLEVLDNATGQWIGFDTAALHILPPTITEYLHLKISLIFDFLSNII